MLASAASVQDTAAAEAYALYQEALRRSNALDFGDLILLGLALLDRAPDVARRYRERLRYVLVDEYQDTNRAQYLWLRALTAIHRSHILMFDTILSAAVRVQVERYLGNAAGVTVA